MANLDKPKGLVPVRHLNGNPWNGSFTMYYKAVGLSEAIFVGTPVSLAGSADTLARYATIKLAGQGPILGVVIAFGSVPQIAADPSNLELLYSPSDTANYVAVVDDPQVIFECQENPDDDTTLTADEVGNNASLTTESGNTSTGKSTVEIKTDTETTTSTLQVRIMRLVAREDNLLGNHSKWEVFINNHQNGQGLGAAGV